MNLATCIAGRSHTVRFAQFLDEQVFLSDTLSKALLVAHLVTLLIFLFFKWTAKEGGVFRLLKDALHTNTTQHIEPARMSLGTLV